MKSMMKLTFPENKLATTVGANGIATDAVVTQPAFKIRVNEEIEYEFDRQKFEEYLSSSSSRSASPSRRRKASSSRVVRGTLGSKTQEPLTIAALAPRDRVPTVHRHVPKPFDEGINQFPVFLFLVKQRPDGYLKNCCLSQKLCFDLLLLNSL